MFKTIHWQSFLRDLVVAQLGFLIYGLAIAGMIRAELGTGPWAVLSVALADQTGTTPGTMIIATGVIVLALAMVLKESIGWGTLGNILFIGPWVDGFLRWIPPLGGNLPLQVSAMLFAILLTGLATAVYISVDAGAGPRDSLMLAISRVSGRSVQLSRGLIEAAVVLLGWLLGGPLGIGTLAFALLIGPAVQVFFRLLHVQTQPTSLGGK